MNYTGPKVRQSRRLSITITPKADKVMQKKNYPPGQHGSGGMRRGKESIYKRQLMEKQRLRTFYNIHERQMRNCYRKAARRSTNTAEAIIEMLESRLDAVVTRGGLARTIYQGRQLVAHGHISVNGKKVDIASYQVKPGDIVTVREKSRKMKDLEDSLAAAANVPEFLQLDKDQFQVRMLEIPKQEQVPVVRGLDLSLIVEFYSR